MQTNLKKEGKLIVIEIVKVDPDDAIFRSICRMLFG